MKVKMDYLTLSALYEALTNMADVSGIKVGYAIAMTTEELRPKAEYFNKRKVELLTKYGEEKDGRIFLSFDNPRYKDFEAEFSELCGIEIEVEIEQTDPGTTAKDFTCEKARAKDYIIVSKYLIPTADTVKGGENKGES